jgi:hypothetical protein
MIEIKEMSREFTKVEKYLMTTAPDIEPLKNIGDGESIPIDGYIIFNDVKDNEDVQEIVSIITPDKKVYSGQSATFRHSLKEIENVMDGEKFSIIKISGKTKAGRDYINCILDVSNL